MEFIFQWMCTELSFDATYESDGFLGPFEAIQPLPLSMMPVKLVPFASAVCSSCLNCLTNGRLRMTYFTFHLEQIMPKRWVLNMHQSHCRHSHNILLYLERRLDCQIISPMEEHNSQGKREARGGVFLVRETGWLIFGSNFLVYSGEVWPTSSVMVTTVLTFCYLKIGAHQPVWGKLLQNGSPRSC